MNCDGVRGLLSAYVDGELSAGELLRVEQHLRRCHWCADEVDALRQTIALVASLEEVEVPAAFRIQLHNRLVALGPPVKAGRIAVAHRSKRQDFRRWAVPAAAAAALVIGAAGLNRFNPPIPVNPPQIGERFPGTAETAQGSPTGEVVSNNPGGGVETGDSKSNVNTVHNSSGEGNKGNSASTGTTNPNPPATSNSTDSPNTSGLGTTSNTPGIKTASFKDDISEPTSYAKVMQPVASAEAAVVEPATLVEELTNHFTNATVRHTTDDLTGIHRLLIIVPSAEFKAGLAFVEAKLGQPAVDQSLPLDLDQMNTLWESLTKLDQQAEELAARKATDPQAEKELALLQEEANQIRQAYQKLVAMSESGTINVTLKPMKGQ
ncbi:MAG: zf-HC2 domain-containing protein [Bacillota bacterium]